MGVVAQAVSTVEMSLAQEEEFAHEDDIVEWIGGVVSGDEAIATLRQ